MRHSHNFKDLAGQKIHRLTFLEYAETSNSGNAVWKVRCDCGTIFTVKASAVKSGSTRSCGCYRIENNKKRANNKRYE